MSALREPGPVDRDGTSDPRLMKAIAAANARLQADAIHHVEGLSSVPASTEQRQVWLDAARLPDAVIYNEPVTIGRRGSFDPATFELAFERLVRRHDGLRTSFSLEGETLLQKIDPDPSYRIPFDDLSGLSQEMREAEAARLMEEDARRPFRLDRAPLFRLRVIRMDEDDHRIQIVLHHILFDGVSIHGILAPELAEFYAAAEAGFEAELQPCRIQYGDYSAWQSGRTPEPKSVEHWGRVFSDPAPEMVLPTDRARPLTATGRGSMCLFELDAKLLEDLKSLGRRNGCTLYMTLLAAFKVLLHRYGGAEDIVVGGVADTRRRPELSGTLGYFLNSFAMRSFPSADKPFSAYLKDVRNIVLASLDACDVPFGDVVRMLGIRPRADRHPLFQVMFSIQPPAPPLPEGWSLNQMDTTVGISKFDLYLELEERPEGVMAARFIYATDLFDVRTIEAMVDHWKNVLSAVVADPEVGIGSIRILSDAEEARIVDQGRGPVRVLPDLRVDELFRRIVHSRPESVAVRCGTREVTYSRLDEMVAERAARLRSMGIGPGHLVGIATSRSVEMVADFMAVLTVGAAYLPLDQSFPKERIDTILEDARPALILGLGSVGPRSVDGEDGTGPAMVELGDPRRAYVIYTSGSTGRPKGVEISHISLVNQLLSIAETPGFGPRDTMFALSTISFDIATLEIFLPLVVGGVLVVATPEIASDHVVAAVAIAGSGCTVVQGTPSTFRSLLAAGWDGGPGMRLWCGGEKLQEDLVEELCSSCTELWNMYGPTETTVWSNAGLARPGEPIRLGRPVWNAIVSIVDGAGLPVPYNVEGELVIGGIGLALGYRDPELTARRFVDMPALGGCFYKSGDIVRRRGGGGLEWLRREDGQLKIRGFRIECGDVEAALLSHPDVAAAAVVPEGEGTVLAAYFTSSSAEGPDAAELRLHLRLKLPDYMVPTKMVRLESMPSTPSGKIDRKALRGEAMEAPVDVAVPQREPDENEALVARLFGEVLGRKDVGPDDDFFDLGGHSLLGVKLLRTIENRYGRRLPMSSLLRTPTASGLARSLFEPARGDGTRRIFPLVVHPGRPVIYWVDAVPGFRTKEFEGVFRSMGSSFSIFGVSNMIDEYLDEGSAVHISDVAAAVAKEIAEHSPVGPIVVGGYCNGGPMAYATACLLREQGREVPRIVLLDSTNPASRPSRATVLLHQMRMLARCGPRRLPSEAFDVLGMWLRGIGRRLPSKGAVDRRTISYRMAVVAAMVSRWSPGHFDGRLILVQSEDGGYCIEGWRNAPVREIAFRDVAGRHVSMLKAPYARAVGETVAEMLEGARADGPFSAT